MGRNIVNEMDTIFKILEDSISDDYIHLVLNLRRHIKAQGDETPVCDFVSKAKIKTISCATERICLFEYKEQRYLLVEDKHSESLKEIGFEFESDISITQGAAMLAISHKQLALRDEINSLLLIERCFGVPPIIESSKDIEFDFSEIADFFVPYCVIKLDDTRFSLAFEEDFSRLVCYLQIGQASFMDEATKDRIKNLLLLHSSRSIAASLINSMQNPLAEYAFLQLYQCIEYLFKLNNCFIISANHELDLETAIDIVLSHEFKISEMENLYQVLRNNASETSIDSMISIIPTFPDDTSDVFKKASLHIYKLRCNIAHLRYNQDVLPDINWESNIKALIEIIFSIYQKRDADIVEICLSKNSWKTISI